MSFTRVNIVHTFENIDGTYATGTLQFRLSATMTNAGLTYTPEIPLVATIGPSGALSCFLPANDDGNLVTSPSGSYQTTPSGTYYVVTFLLNGANAVQISGDEQSIVVTSAAPLVDDIPTLDLGPLLAINSV
jgi:hypothetical protein